MDLPPGRLTAEELVLGRRVGISLAPFLASPTATAVSLPDGRLLLVNDALLRLIGYDRDQVLGVSVFDLMPPAVRAEMRARREEIRSRPGNGDTTQDQYMGTLPLLGKDGRQVLFRVSSVLIRSRAGAPVVFVTRGVPVGPADQPPPFSADQLSGHDAALLAEALAEIPNFDVVADPCTLVSPEGILLRVNLAFTREFGWANHEVAGLLAADLVVPELRSWAEERLVEITGAPLVGRASTTRMRHRDGRSIDVDASSIAVRDETGATRYITGTAVPRESSAETG